MHVSQRVQSEVTKTTTILSVTVHPLQWVILKNAAEADSGLPVPALYLKRLSDNKNWDAIVTTFTTALNIISIFTSVGIIVRGTSIVLKTIAVADILISSLDIAMNNKAFTNYLKNSGEAGKWFVENWSVISIMSSLNILSIEMATRFLSHSDELINVASKTDQSLFSKTDVGNFTDDLKKLKSQAEEVVGGGSSGTKLRLAAFNKWAKKFDTNFVNHLSGDVELITITFKDIWKASEKWLYRGIQGQGGHWLNNFVIVRKIVPPPNVTKVADIALDTPFKAIIDIKSLKGKLFPKKEKSSMFPRNWDLTRIKEEVAFVYENTVAQGDGFIKTSINTDSKIIHQYLGKSTNGFGLLIELDDAKNIINAYPFI